MRCFALSISIFWMYCFPSRPVHRPFVAGRFLDRLPIWAFRLTIGVAVATILSLGVSYFTPIHGLLSDALWYVGGLTTFACVCAMLLLDVVMTSTGRSTSNQFLWALVALVGMIQILNSGGRLWWRFVSETAWHNAPAADGTLQQTSGWTCSPAVAAMLLHHYGVNTTEGEMAYLANTNYLGTDAPSIAHAMSIKGQSHNLNVKIANADYDACLERKEPFLACIHVPRLGGHAILVLKMTKNDLEMVDPRYGHRQRMPRAEIEPQWQNKIVFIEVTR